MKLFKFGPVVQEILFKRLFIQFWHYGEHYCEIISNLDKWLRRRCYLKKKFIERTMDRRHMPDEN